MHTNAARRVAALLTMLALPLLSCSTPATEDDIIFVACTPGTYRHCTCDGSIPGVQVCDKLIERWSDCMCGSDIALPPDIVITGDTRRVPDSQLPLQAVPATTAQVSGGATNLSSPNYRLRLNLAPASPVDQIHSPNYRMRLGPLGGK